MTIQRRLAASGRTLHASDTPAPLAVGSYTSVREAFKALQARRPDVYGADTRNPRWRLRPQ